MQFKDEIKKVETRLDEIDGDLCLPETLKNPSRLKKLTGERSGLVKIRDRLCEIFAVNEEIDEMSEALESGDPDLIEIAKEELPVLKKKKKKFEDILLILLLPKDPNENRDVIVEIRSGTGGEEAALFAADIFRMYSGYAQKKNWKQEILDSRPSERGGFREIIFSLKGEGTYRKLKFEVGVHRVQRVPETETSGRIHTSACTVAVLPEAEEVDVEIKPDDIRIDVFRSSGPGGQSVNTTDSAVRITHLPSGIVVSCQDEKSQHKNRMKATKVLRSRLLVKAQEEADSERARTRKNMVGSGDRSAKIRTYNFPQGRVTDHRIHLTLHNLSGIIQGDLDTLIDALIHDEQERLLAEVSTGIS